MYHSLPKPVLVHCSAGIDRTGYAITYIIKRMDGVASPVVGAGPPALERAPPDGHQMSMHKFAAQICRLSGSSTSLKLVHRGPCCEAEQVHCEANPWPKSRDLCWGYRSILVQLRIVDGLPINKKRLLRLM